MTERVSEMLSTTPAFTGIRGSFDLFEHPTTLPSRTESMELVLYHQCLRDKKLLLPVVQKEAGSAKKALKWLNNQIIYVMSACDLLPLQQEVLSKQREYYRLKKQIPLETDQF